MRYKEGYEPGTIAASYLGTEMARWSRKRIVIGVLLGIAIFYAIQGLLILAFAVAESGTTIREIDVNSGRVRERHFLLGVKVSERHAETMFSKLVKELGLEVDPPDWKLVDRETGVLMLASRRKEGELSGTYWYVGDDFARRANFQGWPPEKKREKTAELLGLLRSGDADRISKFGTAMRAEEAFVTSSSDSRLSRR